MNSTNQQCGYIEFTITLKFDKQEKKFRIGLYSFKVNDTKYMKDLLERYMPEITVKDLNKKPSKVTSDDLVINYNTFPINISKFMKLLPDDTNGGCLGFKLHTHTLVLIFNLLKNIKYLVCKNLNWIINKCKINIDKV